MMGQIFTFKRHLSIQPEGIADHIARVQRSTGEIPWCEGQKTDPWDHVEAAIGLAIGGHRDAAARAYYWLAANQLPEGSWYSAYDSGTPTDRTRETHMAAYLAVGIWHHYLIYRDMDLVGDTWPAVDRAIQFALSLQTRAGDIYWALSPEGRPDPMALLTGSSSIHLSLKCALSLADLLKLRRPRWESARRRLGQAIREKPHLFNMTKSRYAMDWFYPVLSGALTGEAAQERISRYWKKFVIMEQGVRCVSDQPWVTIAETCELCLALAAMGNHTLARIVFGWISDKTYPAGDYWCGFTCPDMVIWPEDHLTWTNAAVLMAADALYDLTPASRLFHHDGDNRPSVGR